jgi:hypothetical protein
LPFQPVHLPQPLLLVPPLLPPLVLRTENGQFGAKRPDIGRFGDCEPCSRFEEPPSRPPDEEDPRDPRLTRYVKHQVHEAVDLEGEAGDCVFAAYGGRVVEVETGAAGVRGNVTIDHHPFATGLVSRYLHLEGAGICVEEGDSVAKGDLIGRIGSGPADPHLHFELRMVLDPFRASDGPRPVRPEVLVTPERHRRGPDAAALPVRGRPAAARGRGAAFVASIGVQTVARVPLFRALTDASPDPYSIPLYEPTTEHERGLIAMLTKALELGRPVEVEYRESAFFGIHRVPASVGMV